MRILLTADPELPVPPENYGGVQRLVAQWADTLTARGHAVGLVAREGSKHRCTDFVPWPGNRSQHPVDALRNALALAQAARKFRAEVVHSSSRLAYTLPLLLTGIPVLMTYHRVPGARQIKMARRLGRRLIFSGVSDFITGRGRAGGGDWRTVHNCVDTARFTYRPEVSADAPLVYLSRIDADKGAHLAVQIARAVNVPLILAGNHSADANAARYWRDEVAPLVDGRLISYIGPVDDDAKNSLLGRARALLVPTQCDEAFGLVFAEALACGTPAIGTRRGAVPEIIRPGKTGYLIETVEEGIDAVRRVAALSRQDCRRDVEARFSMERSILGYEAIYRELTARTHSDNGASP